MAKKKKEEIEINPYYAKLRKDVKQSFYNYDKMFISFISALNKCETQREVISFSKTAVEGFKDAPDELVDYFNASIKNKINVLTMREEIDLIKLRAISKQH